MRIMSIMAMFVVAFITACGSPEIEAITSTVTVTAPPVTVTEQAEPAPAETVVVTETVEAPAAPAEEDAVLQETVMQTTWDDMSPSDQADICMGWDVPELRPMLLDTFVSGAGGMFDRGIAEEFFNKVCP